MEKKQQTKKTEAHIPKGYYIALNGLLISKDPFTLKDALTVFNTVKDILLKEDEKVCIGLSSIITNKNVVEIVYSEILEYKMNEKEYPNPLTSFPHKLDINIPSPVVPPTTPNPISPSFPGGAPNPFVPAGPNPMGPNPFMNPPIYTPIPFYCSTEKPKSEKEKEFFDKAKDELLNKNKKD